MMKGDYPSIVKVEGICGGKAIIGGTRIAVHHIVTMWQNGTSVEAMQETYPHLTRNQLLDALRYYTEHYTEIDADIKANQIENVLEQYGAVMDERGVVHFPERGKADGRGTA